MFGLEFNHAALLGLLALFVPLTAALWYASTRAAITGRLLYSDERLLDKTSPRLTVRSRLPSLFCWVAAATLLVVAAAGPTLERAPLQARAGSLQVVVAFDVSKSAGAEDYKDSIPAEYRQRYFGAHGSRLDKAKHVVQSQILPAISGNQMGFVTYKGDGFAQAELTDDFAALSWVLENWVRIGNAPGGGSDFAKGMQEAIAMFERAPHDRNAQKVIVLFSDGGFTGDPQALMELLSELEERNIRLVVLGLGMSDAAPVPLYDNATGKFLGYYEVDGKRQTSGIDESALQRLASVAGGEYHHVERDGVDGINWPQALSGRDKVLDQRQDVFQYPLLAALVLIGGLALGGVRRWRGGS
jgi:hypothetical protein